MADITGNNTLIDRLLRNTGNKFLNSILRKVDNKVLNSILRKVGVKTLNKLLSKKHEVKRTKLILLKALSKKGGMIRDIKKAGKNNYVVKINYIRKRDGKIGTYNIEPYSERSGNLLYGYKRNATQSGTGIRAFKKSGIISAKVLPKTFFPKWKVEF